MSRNRKDSALCDVIHGNKKCRRGGAYEAVSLKWHPPESLGLAIGNVALRQSHSESVSIGKGMKTKL